MPKKKKSENIDDVRTEVAVASLQEVATPTIEPPGAYDRLLLKKWMNGSPATGRDLTRLIQKNYVLPDGAGGYTLKPGVQKYIPGAKSSVVEASGAVAPGLEKPDGDQDEDS